MKPYTRASWPLESDWPFQRATSGSPASAATARPTNAGLSAIAKCLTTGPLKGRSVDLVGRADPRGETEYNMTLGAKRARHVHNFMGSAGVPQDKMHDTSRGELDATGKDEAGWRLDRRVDVKLRQ